MTPSLSRARGLGALATARCGIAKCAATKTTAEAVARQGNLNDTAPGPPGGRYQGILS